MSTELKTVHHRYSNAEIEGFYEAGYWSESTFNGLVADRAAERPDDVFVFDSTTSLSLNPWTVGRW
jgi:cyclohexanecarboxylate-CoA ligase